MFFILSMTEIMMLSINRTYWFISPFVPGAETCNHVETSQLICKANKSVDQHSGVFSL